MSDDIRVPMIGKRPVKEPNTAQNLFLIHGRTFSEIGEAQWEEHSDYLVIAGSPEEAHKLLLEHFADACFQIIDTRLTFDLAEAYPKGVVK